MTGVRPAGWGPGREKEYGDLASTFRGQDNEADVVFTEWVVTVRSKPVRTPGGG